MASMVQGLSGIESKFSKQEIVDTLRKFRDAHMAEYADALDVYREMVAKKLKGYLKAAKSADFTKFDVPNNLGLITPVNIDKGYTSIINLFLSSKDEEVSLSFDEANKIFNNEWDWIAAATTSNQFYSSQKSR
jgi:hypothetical protein